MQGTKNAELWGKWGLVKWSQYGDQCLIIGHFDAPTMDWKNLSIELLKNTSEQELADAVITCAQVQHVKEATM